MVHVGGVEMQDRRSETLRAWAERPDAEVRQGLSEWERAIRDRDFGAGEALFDATAPGGGATKPLV
jgi:hypothetical protein